jgi:hypothetical protein
LGLWSPCKRFGKRKKYATPETVTSGGSGFGVMAMVAAVSRGFITRSQAVTRLQTIVSFLKNTAPKFHGAFSHWLNGTTGAVVPFGANDDGADLVETSYMMMGLLTARQFFNGADLRKQHYEPTLIFYGMELNGIGFVKMEKNIVLELES